jgi:signal transduction histidine kinase
MLLMTKERLPLRRPRAGRVIGGVCQGLAAHLAAPVGAVRLLIVVATFFAGAGLFFYVWLWITVPAGDPVDAAEDKRPAALSRLAPRLRVQGRRLPVTDIAIGLLLLAASGLMIASRGGVELPTTWLLPTLIVLAGAVLAWSQLDAIQRDRNRERAGGRMPVSIVRLVGGTVLVGLGVFLLVGVDDDYGVLLRSAAAALAVLVGAALVLAPWWLRLIRELGDERAARARESERADIAAHLHDSVLQTLSMIRTRAEAPEDVSRLARAQERELREWLYGDRRTPGTSLAADLRAVVAEVEDTRLAEIEVVVVGDLTPDEDAAALLQATREALVNAVTHGRPPFSLYLEAGDDGVEVFVRDHGDGFALPEVPADRFGVRESIVGRVERRGGSATVTSRPGRTEVHLRMPRRAE